MMSIRMLKILTFAKTPGVWDGNTGEGPGLRASFWGEVVGWEGWVRQAELLFLPKLPCFPSCDCGSESVQRGRFLLIHKKAPYQLETALEKVDRSWPFLTRVVVIKF